MYLLFLNVFSFLILPESLWSRPSRNQTLLLELVCDLKAAETENVWVTVGALLQRNQRGFLIEGSRVVVAQNRFVRTGNLQSGHWTRASCIMEPVKRFSAEPTAWKCTLKLRLLLSPITPLLPIHHLYLPPGDKGDFWRDVNLSRPNFTSHQRSNGTSSCALMSPLSAQRPLC